MSIDQSDNSSRCMFGFNTSRIGKLIADWSVESMNVDMTPSGISLDVNVSPMIIKKKRRYNSHIILIRLTRRK